MSSLIKCMVRSRKLPIYGTTCCLREPTCLPPFTRAACAEPSLSDVAAEVEGEDLDGYSADAAAVGLAALEISPSESSDAASFAGGDVDAEWSTDDGDIQRAHAAQQRMRAPRLSDAQLDALQLEGDAKGYGRMYAAMGGGREGLEACAAGP